ncbi:hypothetical protein AS038_01180 [Arthrobacter sp. NIO-1057]|nr:hypothetical protein AS038_01180 [Arthrobacter sp. NIO-1057]
MWCTELRDGVRKYFLSVLAVFMALERSGANIESAGIINELIHGDELILRGSVFKSIKLPQGHSR